MCCTGLFLPLSELKAVRREAAEQCVSGLSAHSRAEGLATDTVLPDLLAAAGRHARGEADLQRQEPQLRVLCRSMAQVAAIAPAAYQYEYHDMLFLLRGKVRLQTRCM